MSQLVPTGASTWHLPALIATSGEQAARRFVDFFTSNIRNRNTREAYRRAVTDFLAWCEERGITSLVAVEPLHVATWIETLGREASAPTVKQKLTALRHLFDGWCLAKLSRLILPPRCEGLSTARAKAVPRYWNRPKPASLIDSIDTATAVGRDWFGLRNP